MSRRHRPGHGVTLAAQVPIVSAMRHMASQGQMEAPTQASPVPQSAASQQRPVGVGSLQTPSDPAEHVAPTQREVRPVELEHWLSSKQHVPRGSKLHDVVDAHPPSVSMLVPAEAATQRLLWVMPSQPQTGR